MRAAQALRSSRPRGEAARSQSSAHVRHQPKRSSAWRTPGMNALAGAGGVRGLPSNSIVPASAGRPQRTRDCTRSTCQRHSRRAATHGTGHNIQGNFAESLDAPEPLGNAVEHEHAPRGRMPAFRIGREARDFRDGHRQPFRVVILPERISFLIASSLAFCCLLLDNHVRRGRAHRQTRTACSRIPTCRRPSDQSRIAPGKADAVTELRR